MVRHLKLKFVLFYQVLRLPVNVTWKYAFINGEIKVHGTLALYKSSSNTSFTEKEYFRKGLVIAADILIADVLQRRI